jgi:hypothetical protein
MGLIENPKTYRGRDLETIFFRPIFSGENAEQLGIRVLYNMPVPTTIQMWSPQSDILQSYSSGWNGGNSAFRKQKSIDLRKVKAEVGFSASDYFQQVYELITGRADVNLDDLTGTELEQAETEMFRAAIAESLRVMMWMGDTEAPAFNKFDGFLKLVHAYNMEDRLPAVDYTTITPTADNIVKIFSDMWSAATPQLKALKNEGNLAFFVTSDLYDLYEQYLDKFGSDGAYTDMVSGRRELSYHGIKVVDMGISQYMPFSYTESSTHCFLTDRRNLVMAVNTADYPGSEVRMWYNPDEMENRQRATFMVGCEILDESLVVLVNFV